MYNKKIYYSLTINKCLKLKIVMLYGLTIVFDSCSIKVSFLTELKFRCLNDKNSTIDPMWWKTSQCCVIENHYDSYQEKNWIIFCSKTRNIRSGTNLGTGKKDLWIKSGSRGNNRRPFFPHPTSVKGGERSCKVGETEYTSTTPLSPLRLTTLPTFPLPHHSPPSFHWSTKRLLSISFCVKEDG